MILIIICLVVCVSGGFLAKREFDRLENCAYFVIPAVSSVLCVIIICSLTCSLMFSEMNYNEAELENRTLQEELVRIRSADVTDEELATLSIKALDYNRWLVQEKLKNTYWWNSPYIDKRFKDLPMVK